MLVHVNVVVVYELLKRSGVYLWSVAVRSDCDGRDSGGQRSCEASLVPLQ